MKRLKWSNKLPFLLAGLILALITFVPLGQKLFRNNSVNSQTEAEELIKQIGKLIVLPEGEKPTIATVSNREALRNQPFFANTLNGDKVLLYPEAKKAILYRPTTNKIIEVAPIGSSQTVTPTFSPSPRAKIEK